MTDFGAQGENGFDSADLAQDGGEGASLVAGAVASTVLAPDEQGGVVLPAGVSLDGIQVEGRDLVVVSADGTRYVIPEGAMVVPQLVVDGVAVPPLNLAALLLGNEPEPAAGAPQSSGGNFAGAVDPLQDAFGLGDLLPYTELQFPADREREVIPDIASRRPDISIEPDDSGISVINAQDAVSEAGLPARGGEPAGSNSAADSESTHGFINFSSPDGTTEVAINGVAITGVGQTFSTPFGVLTITSIADGRIGYSYRLTDNTTDAASEDRFTVTITDADGDTATASLRISIVDDVPTAADDSHTVPAGNHAAIGGNVITGQGTDSGAAGADTLGADGARVSSVANSSSQSASGNGAMVIQGAYGTLTLNGDGSYSYLRAPGTPGGATDTFTYTLTDGDGDTSTATLTIGIGDAPATVISVPEVGDGTIVDESGLPARDNEAPGSAEPSDVETTSGTITFAAPDGVASVTINGVVVTGAGQQIPLPEGTLTIVFYDPADGTLEYSFTLGDNTGGDRTQVELTVTVTDTDGDSDSEDFVIAIIDDVPTAMDDAAAQGAENAPVRVDAFANDIPGADSVNLVSGVALVDGTLTGAGTVTYNSDGTFTYTPAPGEEGTVTFDYAITDGDGDTSIATVTITLAADSTPTIDVIEAQGGAVVDEAGLPAGSDAAADSETTTGTIAIATGNDTVGSLVVNGTEVTGGGTVAGAHGILTVTVSGGVYSYSYTLTANTDGKNTEDVFSVTVTDSDGDSASAPLVIDIIDDVPTARADADSVSEDSAPVADGNVLTGSGGTDANATDGVADTQAADGAVVITTGSFAGLHGTLTLNADGSYSYALNGADTAVQGLSAGETLTEVFAYTIEDGDGDRSSATLTITINGTDDGVTINGLDGAGAEEVVDEDDLADGSSPDAAALTQAGTFGVNSPDGLGDVSVGGTQVVTDGVFTAGLTVSSALGTLTITGFTPVLGHDGSVIGGTFSYSYTLDDSTPTHPGAGQDSVADSFDVVVTDADGSSAVASLDVQVIDDVPTAQADANGAGEGASIAGNVLGNDKFGADGSAPGGAVTGVAAGSDPSAPITGGVGGVVVGAYGTLTLHGDGSYTYDGTPNVVPPAGATDIFVYTITDGDGDTSTTTLTITLSDSGLAATDGDALVNEAGLASGSDAASNSEVFGGAITLSGGTGPYTYALTGPAAGAHGNLVLNADGTYTYTLGTAYDGATADNGPGVEHGRESFGYTVTDAHGNTATGTIVVDIVDDVPTAHADRNSVAEGGSTSGNVLTDGTDDVLGADGAAPGGAVTGVAAGSDTSSPVAGGVGGVIAGAYGTLTLNADGSYSYNGTSNTVPPAGATETFVYTITDGDGDTSTTTLTITLTDSGLAATSEGAAVDEAALPIGSNPSSTAETATGTLTDNISGGTGPYTFALVGSGIGTNGTLTLKADGTWSYTLATPVDGATADNGPNTVNDVETFTYEVTDAGGNTTTNTLTIDIVDDVPTAADDAASPAEDTPVVIDVLVNDARGADGVDLATGIALATGPAKGSVAYNGDGTFTYTPTPGAEGSDSFTYTITDGDGDTSTATVTITLAADSTPSVSVTDSVVDEAALADGSTPASAAEATSGSFTIGTGNDSVGSLFVGGVDVTGGGAVAGMYGTLRVSVVGGVYSYDYVLDDNTLDHPTNPSTGTSEGIFDSFTVVLTDSDGDVANDTLTIAVLDDGPTAHADTNGVAEGGSTSGNVLTDGTDDVLGADGAALGGAVTGVAAGSDTSSPVSGNVGVAIAGAYGTLTLGADGSYTYASTADAISGAKTDTFVYTSTDGDGDTSTVTLTIDLSDVTLVADNDTVAVDEAALDLAQDGDDLAPGTVTGSTPGATTETVTGALSVAGATGYTLIGGTAGNYGTIQLNADGTYTYTLTAPVDNLPHADDGNDTAAAGDVFTYEATDANGNTVQGTITIDIVDDVPTAANDSNSIASGTFGPVVGEVLTNDATGADGAAVTAVSGMGAGTVGGLTAGLYGTLTLNADGSYSYLRAAGSPGGVSDVFIYTLTDGDGDSTTATLTIDIDDAAPVVGANAAVLLDDDALAGGIADGTGDDADAANLTGTLSGSGGDGALSWAFALTGAPAGFTYESDGADGILIKQGGTTVVMVTLNAATGAYEATQVAPVSHAPGADENNQFFTLSYTVTDADSDSAAGTLTINVDDDTPVAVAPFAVSVLNTAGGSNTAHLDADNDVDDNYGADGAGKVFFTAASIAALEGQALTSGLQPLTYTISGDGLTLTATRPDASVVFTIEMQPAGSPDQYKVTIVQSLDSTRTIDFNDDSYDFVGGNTPWAGFAPDGLPVDDNSPDLLLTPFGEGSTSYGNSINGNANSVGVGGSGGGGQNIGTDEGIRLDYVTDLTGNPAGAPANYDGNALQQDHRFDDHYQVNGASVRFGDGQTNTTISIKAFDATDAHDYVYHNGTLVNVIQIVVSFDGENQVFVLDPSNLTQTLSVGSPGGLGDRDYTVTWVESSPGSGVYHVEITGILDTNVRIATHGETSYEALEILHVSGDDFAITGFGAVTVADDPIDFTVPVSIQDGDGDTVAGGELSITANPATPPVALDLDGDGVEFLGLSAGVMFDYDGDGAAAPTAWVGPEDGLLVHDANGDGAADHGSEIVFGGNGLSDLEGLAAKYDSNHDGVLDAQDAEFDKFGVWQDANGNGVTDAGEFATLGEAGVSSIALVSDGGAHGAANGDVLVRGTTTYTRADGTSGSAADAEFATGAEQRTAQRTAETVAVAAAASALLMPDPVLAHDQGVVADEPLQRVETRQIEPSMPDRADLTDGENPSDGRDLFEAPKEVQPETGQRTADHSAEDFASQAPDAELDAPSGADALGAASEPVADFGGSAFAAFAGEPSGASVMDALLALQAAAPDAAAPAEVPAVDEALSEVAGDAVVDAIIDHFAGSGTGNGNGAPSGFDNGEIDSAVLLKALDSQLVFGSNGAIVPDAVDDAAAMAAAQA